LYKQTDPDKFGSLIKANKLLLKYKVDIKILRDVAEDWRATDWRGRAGSHPDEMQLVTHALVYRKRREEEAKPLLQPDRIPWYKKQGLSVEELDAVIWEHERKRDPKFGEHHVSVS
ncbi:MAG: hypothetical protein QF704_00095, partial [Anaerolineales bacterium]|jgi:hypothetical protein|nr:hypothetical protein [Anaerolineales bacterium]